METFNYNGNNFFKFNNLLEKSTIEKLKNDIDYQIKNNLCDFVPLYQTFNNLHKIYEKDIAWQFFINKINSCVSQITEKKLLMMMCWANVSKENNDFQMHKHNTDFTAVYFLQNNYPEYGTDIQNNIIVKAFENSMVVFDGKLEHGIVNMPEKLAQDNYRYSIVIDYNYV
jgi:hypothetical protein